MKSILFVVIAFLVVVSPSKALPGGQNTKSRSVETVEFCKLVSRPNSYHNRVVRIKAILVENHTPRVDGADSFLYDARCANTDFTVVVAFSDSFNVNDSNYEALEKVEGKPDRRGWTRAAVTLVGEFKASGQRKYGHLDWADSEFVIHTIEKVGTISPTIKWPKRLRNAQPH